MMGVARKPRAWGLFVTAVFAALGLASLGAGQVNPSRGPVDLALTDPALVGAIDIHAHLDPDSPGAGEQVRGIDAFEFATLAKARGMRGFVIKTHGGPHSAAVAHLTRKYAAPGLDVFATMALNLATGGINVAAVEHFVKIKGGWGRIVMMPTRDAESEAIVDRDLTVTESRSHNRLEGLELIRIPPESRAPCWR